MMENGLYEDDLEKQQHAHAIQILAEGIMISQAKIKPLYEGILREYKREAKIRTYLPIIVAKRVREILDKNSTLSARNSPAAG